MTVIGEAFIEVRPDTAGFSQRAEQGIIGGVTSLARRAGAILGGALVVQQGAQFLSDAFAGAEESLAIARQTEAVIRSTGGAAGVTAGQVGNLVDQLSRRNTVDDEAIQQGANLLLTFTNIRNGVGENAQVFDRANQTLVDMAAAMGTDVAGQAILLGKALNDPIAGLAQLNRVGVQFTDEQERRVRWLTENNRLTEAQGIILDELNRQFGGSAAAQATSSERMRIAWGNFQEELGARLIPVMERVTTFLAEQLPGAADTAGRIIGRVVGIVSRVAAAVGPVLSDVVGGVRQVLGVLFSRDFQGGGPFAEDSPFIDGVFRFRDVFVNDVLPVVRDVAGFIQRNLRPILLGLGAAFLTITSPVTAVVAGLVLAYTRFEGFRRVVDAVVRFLVDNVPPALAAVVAAVQSVVEGVRSRWAAISEAVGHVVNVVRAVIERFVSVVSALWRQWGDELLSVASAVWAQVQLVVQTAIELVRGIIDTVLALINGDWGEAWDAIRGVVGAAWDYIVGTVRNIGPILGAAVRVVLDAVSAVFSTAWEGIKAGASSAFDAIVGFVRDLPGRIVGFIGGVALAFAGVGQAILDGIAAGVRGATAWAGDFARGVGNAVIDWINRNVIDRINDLVSFRIDPPGPGPTFTVDPPDIPHIPRLQLGGIIPARPGIGMEAIIGEGSRPEAVIPLPPGLVEGLQAIASGGLGGVELTVVEARNPLATGVEVVRQLRAEQYRQGRGWL